MSTESTSTSAIATRKIVPPLAIGDSKPADPNKPFILRDLPAEIRNQIYSHLVEFPISIPIWFGGKEFANGNMRLNCDGAVRIPIDLFVSCRTLYREAASALYANNTYTLMRDKCCICNSYIEVCGIFITSLGPQTHWLRKLELNVGPMQYHHYFQCLEGSEFAFKNGNELFEVTPLLRIIWNLKLTLDFSFVRSRDWPDSPSSSPDIRCNTTAMTAVMQSICDGQLQLPGYGEQLRAVAIKRDGSGGMLNWGTQTPDWHPQPRRFRSNPDYMTEFIAEDNGSPLKLVARRKPLNLLELPKSIQDDIFSMVVHPTEGTSIDLDKDTKFNCGLVHINEEIYRTWCDRFIFGNNFLLTMITKQMRTTFDGFRNLRDFLRKTYIPQSWHSDGHPDIITGRISRTSEDYPRPGPSYVLKFEMRGAVSLADVRIDMLPLVMETSTTTGTSTLTTQVWTPDANGSLSMAASHTLTLQKLRLNVVMATMNHFYSNPKSDLAEKVPDFCTNGFGEVVQTEAAPDDDDDGRAWDPASEVVYGERGFYYVLHMHSIDYLYRETEPGPGCKHRSDTEFFPFRRNVTQILPYLVNTLDYFRGLEGLGIFRSLTSPPIHCICGEGYCPLENQDDEDEQRW